MSTGCSTLGYLWQAGRGQMALINRARPIEEVLRDEKTPPRIRKLLAEIPAVKSFGEESGLKPTKNYTEYVKLDRPAAVFVVSACERLRFKAKEWSFPVVGSFPYLGWYDIGDARRFAAELSAEGWDVDVRGAPAYSTLGWFRDAVLSSMIPEGDEALGELVNVILHESVHATLYISGQSFFDESLASFVADRLTPRYLKNLRAPGAGETEEEKAYLRAVDWGEKRRRRLHEAYEELSKLYASSVSDDEKLTRKNRILSGLREELKIKREISNATLMQYKTYNTGEKEFEGLYAACGGDWRRFFARLRALEQKGAFGKEQQEDLRSVLGPLAAGGC